MATALGADLVGRDAELEELCSLLGIAAPGDGTARSRAVLLSGDAGVGKTRVLAELCDRARQHGWQVAAGHCLDLADAALAYLPFSEILGRLEAVMPDVTEATMVDQPVLRRLRPGRRVHSSEGGGEEGGPEQADLFEAVHALLERAAAAGPLLVVVEDAHWADRSTRDLLGFLFRRPFESPVALVVSYRSDDLHRRHPLRRQVAEWARLRVERMALGPLDADAVRRLVRALHPDPMSEQQLDDIVARAEGNAFFVEELVGAAWATGGVPADLADLLLVRLDLLDETAQQVVRTAAVAGRRVGHELLAAIPGLDGRVLEDALRAAVERHVLEPVGGDAYQFRHALLAEAVYDDLLPGERVRLHAAYARALQAGQGSGTAAELARHARLGQDLRTALLASVDAGAEAMRVGGPDEAAHHYEQALELLSAPGVGDDPLDVDSTDLALRAADALTAAGHVSRANALLREQLDRLPADADAVERGLLLSALALGQYLIDDENDAPSLAREAVELLAAGTDVQRARALATYARILAGHRREEEAREVGATALALTQRLDMPRLRTDVLTTLAGLQKHHLRDDVRDALLAAIEEARGAGAVNAELRGLYTLARFHQDRAELEEALAIFLAAHERGVAVGSPWAPYVLDSLVMGTTTLLWLGRWDEVLDRLRSAPPAPSPVVAALLRSVEAGVLAARGRSEEATTVLAGLRPFWRQEGLLALHAAGAELQLAEQRDDMAGALETYGEAVAVLGALWRDLFQARLRLASSTLGVLAGAARRQSAADREAAAADADRLHRDGRRVLGYLTEEGIVFGPETEAWTARLEAEHLRWRWQAQQDPPTAEELAGAWRRTEELFARFGHSHELARVRVRCAEVLRAAGDPASARTFGDAARATARVLGARPLLDELVTLGSGAAPASGSPAEPTPLTPREREILVLVAEGRSNGEIGRQLFIATKTVSVHVSNILAKLGASSRTEAAAVGRRRGLLG